MSKPNGVVFYRGPSMIDGKPIVAIMTGLAKGSKNGKTGALIQTWILREDLNPLVAINTGDDYSICGDCKHRGHIIDGKIKERTCYVRLDTAPNNIHKSFHRGIYPEVTPQELAVILGDRAVRGGSYGDPTAVPYLVWHPFIRNIKTAYTQQWRNFPEFASFCMASVDTSSERAAAKMLGYRTFRVRGETEVVEQYEVQCPASAEMGKKTTCELCKACGGHNAKAKADIVIAAHGIGKGHFVAPSYYPEFLAHLGV